MINWIKQKFRTLFVKKIDVTLSEKTSSFVEKVEKKTDSTIASIPSVVDTDKRQIKKRRLQWDVSQFEVPPAEGKTRFHDLNLPKSIMHAVADLGFRYCTPIQAEILPQALTGKDATGQAQTGTGKSAAFLINIFNRMLIYPLKGRRQPGTPRALILAPTRELVLQIEKDANDIGKYTRSRSIAVFGGMGYEKQKKILRTKITDIVVATPGRLMDFMQQKIVNLSRIEILVIDEADRMLDMGFISDIRHIISNTPPKKNRQTMFFSATITPDVMRLAAQWTKDSFSVEIQPDTVAAENVEQIVYIVTNEDKFSLLYNLIEKLECVLVFSNRRDQTRDLQERLRSHKISCALLSGEVNQNKRLKVLEDFRSGKTRVLVATDVAARGIHVDGISHVINYNLPHDPEDYVHRIGRTGRAEQSGISISFACEDDSFYIPAIEEFLGEKITCEHPEDELLKKPPKPVRLPKTSKRRTSPQSGNKFKKRNSNNKRKQTGYKSRRPQGKPQRRTGAQNR